MKQVNIRMDQNTKEKAEKQAKALGLSLSAYLRLLINTAQKK